MGIFYVMYSECICYNNVLNEILPFNQDVLCETMDYTSFHIRKKLFYFIQGVTNTVFRYIGMLKILSLND